MKNPLTGKQKMRVPLVRNKGNAPWLKVRKRMRKSVFRGM